MRRGELPPHPHHCAFDRVVSFTRARVLVRHLFTAYAKAFRNSMAPWALDLRAWFLKRAYPGPFANRNSHGFDREAFEWLFCKVDADRGASVADGEPSMACTSCGGVFHNSCSRHFSQRFWIALGADIPAVCWFCNHIGRQWVHQQNEHGEKHDEKASPRPMFPPGPEIVREARLCKHDPLVNLIEAWSSRLSSNSTVVPCGADRFFCLTNEVWICSKF